MPINLELKARIHSPSKVLRILNKMVSKSEKLDQTDTYFDVKRGRLKLREFAKGKTELIYYNRNEKAGHRWSNYRILPISDSQTTKGFLTEALGVSKVVKKTRRVYYYKEEARIHVDKVRGMGLFIEFEVFCRGSKKKAVVLYNDLRKRFEIKGKDIIRSSYADLG
ncbi:MAG: class IV adenylate cyclase [Bacteroidota bacterium]